MSAALQITNIDGSGNSMYVTFNIVVSGNYPPGGEVLNFAAAALDPAFQGIAARIISSNLLQVDIWGQGGGSIGSNQTNYVASCTKVSGVINPATGVKMKVATLGALTEHGATAYESQYLTDLITGMAVFSKEI